MKNTKRFQKRLKNIEKVSEVYEVDQITAPTVAQTSTAATSATAQPAAGSEDAQYTGGEDTGEIIDAGGGDAEGSLAGGVIDKSQQGIEKLLTTLLTQRDENTQVRLAEIKRQTKKDKISLGIQGAGLLLNAIGEMQKAKAAESIRTMKIPDEWKKSGVPGIDWKGIKF